MGTKRSHWFSICSIFFKVNTSGDFEALYMLDLKQEVISLSIYTNKKRNMQIGHHFTMSTSQLEGNMQIRRSNMAAAQLLQAEWQGGIGHLLWEGGPGVKGSTGAALWSSEDKDLQTPESVVKMKMADPVRSLQQRQRWQTPVKVFSEAAKMKTEDSGWSLQQK